MTDVEQSPEDAPEGLSGWLLLVLFYLVFMTGFAGFRIWVATVMESMPGFGPTFAFAAIAFNVALIALSVRCLILFFKKDAAFPSTFRNWLWVNVGYGVAVSVSMFFSGLPFPIAKMIAPTLRELIAFWIFGAYINSARRVAATFVR